MGTTQPVVTTATPGCPLGAMLIRTINDNICPYARSLRTRTIKDMADRYNDQPTYVQKYVTLHKAVHDRNWTVIDDVLEFLIDSMAAGMKNTPMTAGQDQPMYYLSQFLTQNTLLNQMPGGLEDMPLDPQWIETIDLALSDTHPNWYLPGYVEATCAKLLKDDESRFDNEMDYVGGLLIYAALTDVILTNLATSNTNDADDQNAEQLYWEKFNVHMRGAFEYLHQCEGKEILENQWGLPVL